MPFKITNAPTKFVNTMNHLLSGRFQQFNHDFQDNVLIHNSNIQDHAKYLKKLWRSCVMGLQWQPQRVSRSGPEVFISNEIIIKQCHKWDMYPPPYSGYGYN